MAHQLHRILNGQYVSIEQTPASIGHRIGAQAVDYILLYAYIYTIIPFADLINQFSGSTYVWAVLALVPTIYHPVCELLWGGSVGKRLTSLRIVMQNGEPPTIGAIMLRWLLFWIDSVFALGLIVMMCNKRNMRLGDLAAGTIIISTRHDNDQRRLMEPFKLFTYLKSDYQPRFPFASELTWGQINFINHTMLAPNHFRYARNQKANIERLAKMLAERYNVEGLNEKNYNKFLQTIVSDYNYFTWHDTV